MVSPVTVYKHVYVDEIVSEFKVTSIMVTIQSSKRKQKNYKIECTCSK